MFWKARVEKKSELVPRLLNSIVIKQQGKRMIARMTFQDGTFVDVECAQLPRFNLGEELTLTLGMDIEVPTISVEQR